MSKAVFVLDLCLFGVTKLPSFSRILKTRSRFLKYPMFYEVFQKPQSARFLQQLENYIAEKWRKSS